MAKYDHTLEDERAAQAAAVREAAAGDESFPGETTPEAIAVDTEAAMNPELDPEVLNTAMVGEITTLPG